MFSALVLLGCLGVLVPQQSPKVTDAPSEAQLLAIITNAYRDNYGKVQNLKVTEQIELGGPDQRTIKRKAIYYIKNNKIRHEVTDSVDNTDIKIINVNDQIKIYFKSDKFKMIFTGNKQQASNNAMFYKDFLSYGNILKAETIPELLEKLTNKKVQAIKNDDASVEITVSGICDKEFTVNMTFSSKNSFLCTRSLFVSINKPIRESNYLIKYEKPKGCNYLFPLFVEEHSGTKLLYDETYVHESDIIHKFECHADKLISDNLFENKMLEGYQIFELSTVKKKPEKK